ncbi:hypothetical protein Bxe_A4231 [Paraburkholderia xenovorans LB400]|uniref:Uncharacterized protein n=1 Tax=Paraburkholderia xenovorans (strain LB400) TaxID=266265 RepID=Q146H0_PARXL|nr:hypothetical protein Bxe_A4231 [Paraburkholderia xenovorans LB400]
MKHGGATCGPGAVCQGEFASVMVLTPIFETLRESRIFLRKVSQALELRLLRCGFRQVSVLSLCKLHCFWACVENNQSNRPCSIRRRHDRRRAGRCGFHRKLARPQARVSLTHGWPRSA